MNSEYAPTAAPRLAADTWFTASTPNAGNTSEKPNPLNAAPAKASSALGASHSINSPSVSTDRQAIATLKPPMRLIRLPKSSRALMKLAPNRLRVSAALAQPRLA